MADKKERPKFMLTCPKCGKQHGGKQMMHYKDNKVCSCGYAFEMDWMENQLEKYLAQRKAEKAERKAKA